MEQLHELIEKKQFQAAYEYWKDKKEDNAEYYIYMAFILENLSDWTGALEWACKGYECNRNNYELLYMMGNYELQIHNQEKAYVDYLLAVCLCDNEDDSKLIKESCSLIQKEKLNPECVRITLGDELADRVACGEYDKTYQMLTSIVYSEDGFLFQKIIDERVRKLYIMMEIAACEKKHGSGKYIMQDYLKEETFYDIFTAFKFAIRKLWFGFIKEGKIEIENLLEEFDVSADYLAIAVKYSVHENYVASVLKYLSVIVRKKDEKKSDLLNAYAEWFQKNNTVNLDIIQKESKENSLQVHYIELNKGQRKEDICINKNIDKEIFDNKISYIMCANNERYVKEALFYIEHQLLLPEYEMDVYVVTGAKSMTQGYNAAMKASDAKYKIYIHQDTFVFDIDFTLKIVNQLKKEQWQMIGVAGTEKMPDDGIWWNSIPAHKHLCLYQDWMLHILHSVTDTGKDEVIPAECLDGVYIATGRDTEWREDLFGTFHFYDVSQGMEFHKKGWNTGVLIRENPGILHEVSVGKSESSQKAYEMSRKKYNEIYGKNKI